MDGARTDDDKEATIWVGVIYARYYFMASFEDCILGFLGLANVSYKSLE